MNLRELIRQPSLAPDDSNAGYRRAKFVWLRLPEGPWQCRKAHDFEDMLLLSISKIVSPNALVRDTGVASAIREGLVAGGFLTAHSTNDLSVIEYRKAAECPPPDTRTWEQQQNDHLRQLQAEEKRMLDEDAENRERLAKQAAEMDPQRGQLIRLLNEIGVVPRDELAGIVEAAVAAALARREATGSGTR
jgi:hypothetical protein